MENFHNLSILNPTITGWHIRVKVLRSFRAKQGFPPKDLILILGNEEGMMIEAIVDKKFADYYANAIEEGQWLSIMEFAVVDNTDDIKKTSHPCKIYFLRSTCVKHVLPLPHNEVYHFASFSSIINDTIDVSVLADVVGAVFYVSPLMNVANNPHNVSGFRISFKIKDKDEHTLECVAMEREALDFDRNYRLFGGGVLVAVLRWWEIDRYFDGPKNVRICTHGSISKVIPNPNIIEVAEIRAMLERTEQENGV
ncbi:Nucleic acid-binding OB-fold [Arabidopsis suecica]|uniref:Nucleic acid-binding OB-fold n=1 Tax=Arabidopsis suecica TaxID=45249 RepID=A0A8T2BAN9_ARASU|nr:Nucleic acid-binding OB-fold [Arabidopsis suecica]